MLQKQAKRKRKSW